MTKALHFDTIKSLAPQLRAGIVTPTQLTECMLERIDKHDSRLKAYVTLMRDSALREALSAEREIAAGKYRGPLHGIPLAVKDLCFTAGVATMAGCEVLREHVPSFDATVVSRLRDAGAIVLGKLNLTEGAMAGYNPTFDVPENPWKEGHWSGASSSGSGAATAAGLAYATLGSDTGGSIRHPAAVCGTVGLKPTWGRVSRYGVLDLAQSLDHVGPLTRASRDAGFVFDAIAGRDEHDPTTLARSIDADARELTGSESEPLRGLRVGWDANYASADLAADFAAAVARAAEQLQRLGATLVDVRMPERLQEYMPAWQVLCSSEAAHAHRAHYPHRADEYGPWFRQWLEYGNGYSVADYAHANNLRAACVGELAATMRDVDVLACPSTPRAAFLVSPAVSYGPILASRDPWDSRFTVPSDFAGLPTLALPCGLSDQQLPLSFQLVGHHCCEAQLVNIGDAFEESTDWHRLHPPGWD